MGVQAPSPQSRHQNVTSSPCNSQIWDGVAAPRKARTSAREFHLAASRASCPGRTPLHETENTLDRASQPLNCLGKPDSERMVQHRNCHHTLHTQRQKVVPLCFRRQWSVAPDELDPSNATDAAIAEVCTQDLDKVDNELKDPSQPLGLAIGVVLNTFFLDSRLKRLRGPRPLGASGVAPPWHVLTGPRSPRARCCPRTGCASWTR